MSKVIATSDRFVEYGVQPAHGTTILTVTEDLAEAHQMLGLLGEGRLVRRTVTLGRWQPVADDARESG